MKKIFLVLMLTAVVAASAVPVYRMPAVRVQPNGDTLHLFVTGDEYYHRLHDAEDYTIVQNPRTGYWVYADTVHLDVERWDVVVTNYAVGTVLPASVGLHPSVGVDRMTWQERQHRFDIPKAYESGNGAKTSGANHGTLNNIVIFVRFSDETEISTSLSTINAMFNDSSANATSMYSYFKKVSYGKIFIPTRYFPTPNGNNVVSYQDSLPRSYYKPYDATTNPNGYQNDTERRNREFGLLERAVNYVNANSPIPTSLNLDMDNDGYVDNICFVVKGTYTGWSDLLWPHKWSLYDRYVYINGKRVYTFNLQLEGSGSSYFGSSTFCHEMFHTLGAPDLYRYENNTNVSGVGSWDLMCSNSTPPQHMSAYMKWKYGNWIDSIPEITVPGTYTLHSLGDDTYENCCYKIAAQEPHQWYVLEYRDNTERFETALPGKGLIIFRIDDRYHGNANFDGVSTFDEVYLFRPNAHNDTTNGTLSQAYFSGNTNRTAFTPTTNPHPWLTDNVIDTTIAITNVTVPGATISFTYSDLRGCRIPLVNAADNITGTSAHLSWSGNAPSYVLQWKIAGESTVNTVSTPSMQYQLTGLSISTQYQWRVRGVCNAGDSSYYSDWLSFTTPACITPVTYGLDNSDTNSYSIPINTYYNYTYSQMIYTAAEMGGALDINKIAFNYAYSNPTITKDDCVIYMGNTTQSAFNGTAMSNFVPFSQLQKVYEGPLNCSVGWNEFVLDSVFHYNGTGNLVVAIDDNSGDYDGSSYKFYCTQTGTRYSTLTYYSDSDNPNPSASSNSGSKARRRFVADMHFFGCTPSVSYTVTVTSNNESQGTVSGGGIYIDGNQATITATPELHYVFDYWLSGTDTIRENPYTFVVTDNELFTAYFRPEMHTVTLINGEGGSVSGQGSYQYGSTATITAEPDANWHFDGWICNDDTIRENPYSFIVTNDTMFAAKFIVNRYRLTVSVNDTALGDAWFVVQSTNEALNEAWLEYGTQIVMYAKARTNVPGMVCQFDGWSDCNAEAVRSVTVTDDADYLAMFSAQPVGIDNITTSIVVIVRQHTIIVSGAENRRLVLYDVMGRRIMSVMGTEQTLLPVPNKGVYLVGIEGLPTRKVVVR